MNQQRIATIKRYIAAGTYFKVLARSLDFIIRTSLDKVKPAGLGRALKQFNTQLRDDLLYLHQHYKIVERD
jgi:hypothetical protein